MNTARMVGLRVYLCLSGLLSAFALWDSPHVFAATEDLGRLMACAALAFVSGMGLLDTLVNDILGSAWCLRYTDRRRHNGYIALAVVNLSLIFVAVNHHNLGMFLGHFILDAAMATYVAVRDVQIRFIQPRKETKTHHAEHSA